MIKKSMTVLAFAMVLALSVLFLSIPGSVNASATTPTASSDKRIVSTNGEGTITVTPDIAFISMGIETSDKAMGTAQQINKDKMNLLVQELTKLGINKEDIQTQSYNVYPDYQWQSDKSVLVGYKVSNMLKVKIRNLDNAGKILDAVASKEANMVYGIQFDVSDTNKAYKDALTLAVRNAEDKAKLMVSYFGVKAVKPLKIQETSSNSYRYPYPIATYDKADTAGASTSVSPGQMEIKASVSIEFEY